IASHWTDSAHAHAYDDPVFQQRWAAMGRPDDYLNCHTTNFQPATGEFDADGVGCMQCHDPHSQGPLFADADEMCLNCHADSMGDYLEDLHVSQGIGCVDCHALVIPPDPLPDDGIVPTGHAFDITPATCVACHTDTLHAGFSLPGYESGAAQATNGDAEEGGEVTTVGFVQPKPADVVAAENGGLTAEQRIQALEAALASRNASQQFQGGLVGLVFGGMTAWFVASNMRQRNRDE